MSRASNRAAPASRMSPCEPWGPIHFTGSSNQAKRCTLARSITSIPSPAVSASNTISAPCAREGSVFARSARIRVSGSLPMHSRLAKPDADGVGANCGLAESHSDAASPGFARLLGGVLSGRFEDDHGDDVSCRLPFVLGELRPALLLLLPDAVVLVAFCAPCSHR